jgi:hypothetical protein
VRLLLLRHRKLQGPVLMMAGELLDAEVTGGPIMARAALEQAKTA